MFIICRKIHTTSDLYSRIAELTSKKIIDAQTENFYLVGFLSLIRPFIKGEVSVEKIIQLIRDAKLWTSKQFVHLKVPFIFQKSKMNKTNCQPLEKTVSRTRTQQHDEYHPRKKHMNDNIPVSQDVEAVRTRSTFVLWIHFAVQFEIYHHKYWILNYSS